MKLSKTIGCFLITLSSAMNVSADNELTIVDDEVYDSTGAHYKNEGSFRHMTIGGPITMDCPPLAVLINPSIPPDHEKYPEISRLECVIKKSTIEGDYEKVEGKLPPIEKQFLIPTNLEPQASISACYTFAAYAPPSVWAPYINVYSHIGAAYFTVKYKWFGDTYVNSKVRYFGPNDSWIETVYFQQYSFRTGNAASSIFVTYMGIPTGSSVEGEIC